VGVEGTRVGVEGTRVGVEGTRVGVEGFAPAGVGWVGSGPIDGAEFHAKTRRRRGATAR
jgi:hypothetical protein